MQTESASDRSREKITLKTINLKFKIEKIIQLFSLCELCAMCAHFNLEFIELSRARKSRWKASERFS